MWLLITVSAYFLLAISAAGDKFILKSGIPDPKVYSFYVGLLSIFVLVLIPFGFSVPDLSQIFLAVFTGIIFVIGLFIYYSLAKEFEISRISPAIGGLMPVFSLIIAYLFFQSKFNFSSQEISALLLLIIGSVLIVLEKTKNIFGKVFFLSSVAAFYFALYFILANLVYEKLGFINGFIWIRFGGFLMAPLFLLSKEVRSQIFKKGQLSGSRTTGIFLGNQVIGSGGALLQNLAVSLVKMGEVALINALQGVMYAFLFIFSLILSKKFPQILKEEISKEILVQKVIAILLIGGGLALLALK